MISIVSYTDNSDVNKKIWESMDTLLWACQRMTEGKTRCCQCKQPIESDNSTFSALTMDIDDGGFLTAINLMLYCTICAVDASNGGKIWNVK